MPWKNRARKSIDLLGAVCSGAIDRILVIRYNELRMQSDVTNLKLTPGGTKRIEWADHDMLVLAEIRRRFAKAKPLRGLRVSACLHVTAETANLMRTLKSGGANVV